MAEINAIGHAERIAPVGDQTVGEFWTRTYLPWAKQNLRRSSWHGYARLWKQYLEKHIAAVSLKKYKTVDGSRFLTSLTPRLNRNTLGHVRSLASGIFTLALNHDLIERNPWHDVKVLAKVRPPKPKVAYTDEETKAILSAVSRTDAKLFFSLCAVLGLRPSETAAVKWEDFSTDKVKISRAAPYGHAGETKTEASKRTLDLIEPVKSLVATWREECGDPKTGWLFTRPGGEPVNHNAFARRYIGPFAKEVCVRWCGCYSGRHGTATSLYASTGDVRSANQVLGNSLQVVMANYIKPDAEQGRAGLKLREAALNTATT
jgi:integrase